MLEGPNISIISQLIGDPARANMLSALMSGKALTGVELALEAGVTAQTASSHLSKMVQAGLVSDRKQGRHKYYTLANEDIVDLLEKLMVVAARSGHMRVRTGPKDPALRRARACYNHLAGEMGVRMFEALMRDGHLEDVNGQIRLTTSGIGKMAGLEVALPKVSGAVICKPCLDWSQRKNHLGGALGRAILARFEAGYWIRRTAGSRVVEFTPQGMRQFDLAFPVIGRG